MRLFFRCIPLLVLLSAVLGCHGRTSSDGSSRRSDLPADPAYQEGNRSYLKGEFAPAIDAYGRFLSQNPESPWIPETHYRIALSLTVLGRYDEAGESLDRAEAARPDRLLASWIRMGRGDLAFARNDYLSAADTYEELLRTGGNDVETDSLLYRAGLSRIRSGDWSRGRTLLCDRLIREFPNSPWTRKALTLDLSGGDCFWLQVGIFTDRARAEELVARLGSRGISANLRNAPDPSSSADGLRYEVRTGPYPSYSAAVAALEAVKKAGVEPVVVP